MIRASEIADFLETPLHGPDVSIDRPQPLSRPLPNSLLFVKAFDARHLAALNLAKEVLVLAPPEYSGQLEPSHILTPRPRLAMARVLRKFFAVAQPAGIARTAIVAPSARIAPGVSIGEYAVIGPSVEIGEGTVIRHHVVIDEGTRIGCRCLIKSHAVIGEEGFGIEFDESDMPVHLPHIGRVVIGDDVEVGVFCTIARATLAETVIGNFVKLDDHVHIAQPSAAACELGAAPGLAPMPRLTILCRWRRTRSPESERWSCGLPKRGNTWSAIPRV
jgi:UDP-3-O-[3-hydroxymyristoyl] glucosamine N-acyltransferase